MICTYMKCTCTFTCIVHVYVHVWNIWYGLYQIVLKDEDAIDPEEDSDPQPSSSTLDGAEDISNESSQSKYTV